MTYLLFFAVCFLLAKACVAFDAGSLDDSAAIVIAILTAGEVISLRCKK